MTKLHSVLLRQLRRVGLDDPSELPDSSAWSNLLERVSASYESADDDRYRLERSLDISSTEMEELHTQIRDERDRLHTILAALSDGICYLADDWTVQFLNAAGESLIGVSNDQATGKPLFEFIEFQCSEQGVIDSVDHDIESDLRGGMPVVFNDCRLRNQDFEVPANITFNPMLRDGKLSGIVLKITDITSQKQAESKVEKAQDVAEEARQARQAQAAFLANMSHELRTPLNAIIGYSELVTEDAKNFGYGEVISDLQKIRMAGRHLVNLINDVLDMSKIEAGKIELDMITFSADELVQNVAAMIEPEARKSGNQLVVDTGSRLGAIRSDRTKLQQILTNLLNNATKFTTDGTIRLKASKYQRDQKQWFRFDVKDTGIGIPEDKIPKLFTAFTQADESTTRKYGGTGLGLTISQNFAETLGGRIEVDSEVDVGTLFSVHIPAGSVKDSFSTVELMIPDDLLEQQAQSNVDDGTPGLLIIDDERSVHEMIARYLAHRQVQVHSALSGRDGIEMAHRIEPDAIIVDVLMPAMNGWQVLDELKSDPNTESIPVIVGSILSDEAKAQRLGADGYMTKPIDRQHLEQLVDQYATADDPSP